jgi:hypothetical protein
MMRIPIEQRIRAALNGRSSAPYHDLMLAVFPPEQYPNAYGRSSNGGPPGCAMAFNAALRRMGGGWDKMGSERTVWVPKI